MASDELAAETEANESCAVGRQMNSSAQEASFEIQPKDVRENNADEGLKTRVGWAEPNEGGLREWEEA